MSVVWLFSDIRFDSCLCVCVMCVCDVCVMCVCVMCVCVCDLSVITSIET